MGIQDYILAGSQLPLHNQYLLRFPNLKTKQPGVGMSMLRFSRDEAISRMLRHEIEFTRTSQDTPAEPNINSGLPV